MKVRKALFMFVDLFGVDRFDYDTLVRGAMQLSYSKYRTAGYWGYERVTDIAMGRLPCTELIKKENKIFLVY